MKKLIIFLSGLALATFVIAQPPTKPGAPQKRKGRDLYVSKEESGAKMTIELKRDGKTQFVPPDTEFRAGDKVAFHFEVNFAGYVAVINDGTSGKKSLLFPYEGANNQIPANQTYRVPQAGVWFEFDKQAGEEKLLFVMSTKPLPGINQPPAGGGGSSGGPVSGDQEQQILNEVNSRALRKGRDLTVVKEEGAGYVTTSQSLAEPVGLLLKLIHR